VTSFPKHDRSPGFYRLYDQRARLHAGAPWAYLHGRYLYDVGPAQEQGFLNLTADFLLYGLVSSPLNGHSPAAAGGALELARRRLADGGVRLRLLMRV
jgi:hypothetical protein